MVNDFDGKPTWSVEEAFAAFNQWVAEHFDEVGHLEIDEQAEAYHAAWVRRNN